MKWNWDYYELALKELVDKEFIYISSFQSPDSKFVKKAYQIWESKYDFDQLNDHLFETYQNVIGESEEPLDINEFGQCMRLWGLVTFSLDFFVEYSIAMMGSGLKGEDIDDVKYTDSVLKATLNEMTVDFVNGLQQCKEIDGRFSDIYLIAKTRSEELLRNQGTNNLMNEYEYFQEVVEDFLDIIDFMGENGEYLKEELNNGEIKIYEIASFQSAAFFYFPVLREKIAKIQEEILGIEILKTKNYIDSLEELIQEVVNEDNGDNEIYYKTLKN